MSRTIKKYNVRKLEIILTAEDLFYRYGYENTTVNKIIKKIGIAKGTFYHYFHSKNDLLSAIIENNIKRLVKESNKILENNNLSAVEKIKKIFSPQNPGNKYALRLEKELHDPKNRELHEKTSVQIIVQLSPILAKVINEGIEEGVFKVENSLETIQFILAGNLFLFNKDLFSWDQKKLSKLYSVMQNILEKSLGTKKGTFNFLNVNN